MGCAGSKWNQLEDKPYAQRNLLQQTSYITLAGYFPKPFSTVIPLQSAPPHYAGASSCGPLVPVTLEPIQPTLLMSSCAYQGRSDIDNILDGYSSGLVVELRNAVRHGRVVWQLKVACQPIEDAMFKREMRALKDKSNQITGVESTGASLLPGLFNGKTKVCKSICGTLCPCLCCSCCGGSTSIERTTAHQPIWLKDAVMFCSAVQWQPCAIDNLGGAFEKPLALIAGKPKDAVMLKQGYPGPQDAFHCMHPHKDLTWASHKMPNGELRGERLLSYTFTHSVLCGAETHITFWELGYRTGDILCKLKADLKEFRALHMFGYTQNYYILFANPLSVNRCDLMCKRKSVLRTLDDQFSPNLVLYFWRRPSALEPAVPEKLVVDTMMQGFVYHTVNCYETVNADGSRFITVDGWASQLNAARESSQFELRTDANHSVFDNQGDLYRWTIHIDKMGRFRRCDARLMCPLIDSSIDFHCIHPAVNARDYRFFWMIRVNRNRDTADSGDGSLLTVDSDLVCLDLKTAAVEAVWSVGAWYKRKGLGSAASFYMRTPMFVPRLNPAPGVDPEKQGYLVVWAYQLPTHPVTGVAPSSPVAGAGDTTPGSSAVIVPIEGKGTDESVVDEGNPKLRNRKQAPPLNRNPWSQSQVVNGVQDSELQQGPPAGPDATPRTSALLLIFDAATFSASSDPRVVELCGQHIPYSVHSFTHPLEHVAQDKEACNMAPAGPPAQHM